MRHDFRDFPHLVHEFGRRQEDQSSRTACSRVRVLFVCQLWLFNFENIFSAALCLFLSVFLCTGGRFSLVGSVIGTLIIQTLTYAIYSLGVPPEINLVVKAVVVFIVMLLQSPEFRAQVGALARRPGAGALQ